MVLLCLVSNLRYILQVGLNLLEKITVIKLELFEHFLVSVLVLVDGSFQYNHLFVGVANLRFCLLGPLLLGFKDLVDELHGVSDHLLLVFLILIYFQLLLFYD